MEDKIIFVSEDSYDGILTAIYDAWCQKIIMTGFNEDRISIIAGEIDNYQLFAKYITVETDQDKAVKVANSIRSKISADALKTVYHAAMSFEQDKCDTIFHFLIKGFKMGACVLEHIADKHVMRIYELDRSISNEAHHYLGFVRFEELNNRLLFSKINPKNNILTIIADHFCDRLSIENFIIYDESRRIAAVHKRDQNYFIINNEEIDLISNKNAVVSESIYEDLWKVFFKNIGIKSRYNKELQRNNLPYRFRKDLLEFQ